MTDDVPRRLRPGSVQRVKTILTQTRGAKSAQGTTAASRPVVKGRRVQTHIPTLPGALGVTVGDTSGGNSSTAISFTTGTGTDSTANSEKSFAGGFGSNASGWHSVAAGNIAEASADEAVSIGSESRASGTHTTAAGAGALAQADRASAFGYEANAIAAGSVAIGADSAGGSATAVNEDEFVLGTANHIVIVAGKLVIADNVGGLHQIVVSTGGALSTVAYP